MQHLPPLRTLTGLTGAKAHTDRTTVVATVDVSVPVLHALGWAAAPVVLTFGLCTALLGPVGALAVAMLVGGGVMWLILGRSSSGLKRRHYQTMLDRAAHKDGVFTLCGHPIDPHTATFLRVVSSSVPLLPVADTDIDLTQPRRAGRERHVDQDAFTSLPRPARRAVQAGKVRHVGGEPDLDLTPGATP